MDVCALVLAAGEDRAMHSERTRFVHDICGRPMIVWLSQALEEAGAKEQLYVVGYKQEQLRQTLGEDKIYVFQEELLGPGHAVRVSSSFLESRSGCTLVLPGDAPLLTAETLKSALKMFERRRPAALVLSAMTNYPDAAKRLVPREDGLLEYMGEEGEADISHSKLHEVDTGIYCFDTALLLSTMGQIDWSERGRPLRMPMILAKMIANGREALRFRVPLAETVGVDNRVELETVRRRMNRRICHGHMMQGVTIENPDACFIEVDVKLGRDVHVASGCRLTGHTEVAEGTALGPRCFLHDARVGENCRLAGGNFLDARLGDDVRVGFGANFKGGVSVERGVRVGDDVTLEDCRIGPNCELRDHISLSHVELAESCFVDQGVVSVDALPLTGRASAAENAEKLQPYSSVGAGAEIGALSRLFKPFSIDAKADVPPGSIVKASKKSILPWGRK